MYTEQDANKIASRDHSVQRCVCVLPNEAQTPTILDSWVTKVNGTVFTMKTGLAFDALSNALCLSWSGSTNPPDRVAFTTSSDTTCAHCPVPFNGVAPTTWQAKTLTLSQPQFGGITIIDACVISSCPAGSELSFESVPLTNTLNPVPASFHENQDSSSYTTSSGLSVYPEHPAILGFCYVPPQPPPVPPPVPPPTVRASPPPTNSVPLPPNGCPVNQYNFGGVCTTCSTCANGTYIV